MPTQRKGFITQQNLVALFTLASFIIIISGTAGIGWWVGEQIKNGDIHETAATTSLYVDSFISPNIQELSQSKSLTPEHIRILSKLLSETGLGHQIVALKIWDESGNILFSTTPSLIGKTFPLDNDVTRSYRGEVVANISNLQGAENIEEKKFFSELLQIYSPVRLSGSNQIIAVAEFYQRTDILNAELKTAQSRSWFIVGTTMVLIYLALVGFVRWANNTIGQQDIELKNHVVQLTGLLTQNNELRERVQRAAANASAINETFLRRISAELHDGPVQELGSALLRLDRVIDQNQACLLLVPNNRCGEQLPAIQTSVQNAIQEVRSLAAGLGLPQLDGLSLAEVISRVVQSHERRTGTSVSLTASDLPEKTELPLKITTFRLIQEALNNIHRHAGGEGQRVIVTCQAGQILIEVSDQGPGFNVSRQVDWEEHMGLAGMQERVESLGGSFQIESKINQGTKIVAQLPLQTIGKIVNGQNSFGNRG